MYAAEFIIKKSVYDDVVDNYKGMGHKDEATKGGFIFRNLERPPMIQGHVITVHTGEAIYHYNMNDFYRVKVREV